MSPLARSQEAAVTLKGVVEAREPTFGLTKVSIPGGDAPRLRGPARSASGVAFEFLRATSAWRARSRVAVRS